MWRKIFFLSQSEAMGMPGMGKLVAIGREEAVGKDRRGNPKNMKVANQIYGIQTLRSHIQIEYLEAIEHNQNGQNQTNCQEVDRPEGPQETAGCSEDRQEVRPRHHRCQEAPPLQARNRCPQGNQKVPEVNRPPHQEAPLPENGQGNRPRMEAGTQVPVIRRACPPGGCRGLPRLPVRGHQPVRHPRQESDHHDQGSPAGQEDQRRQVLILLIKFASISSYSFQRIDIPSITSIVGSREIPLQTSFIFIRMSKQPGNTCKSSHGNQTQISAISEQSECSRPEQRISDLEQIQYSLSSDLEKQTSFKILQQKRQSASRRSAPLSGLRQLQFDNQQFMKSQNVYDLEQRNRKLFEDNKILMNECSRLKKLLQADEQNSRSKSKQNRIQQLQLLLRERKQEINILKQANQKLQQQVYSLKAKVGQESNAGKTNQSDYWGQTKSLEERIAQLERRDMQMKYSGFNSTAMSSLQSSDWDSQLTSSFKQPHLKEMQELQQIVKAQQNKIQLLQRSLTKRNSHKDMRIHRANQSPPATKPLQSYR